jgi:hypothetical protein
VNVWFEARGLWDGDLETLILIFSYWIWQNNNS